MALPRLVLVDNQMSGESFVSIGPLVLAAISETHGLPVQFCRFPKYQEIPAFLENAAGAPIVAFSTVCANYPRVLLLARRLKALHPETLVVLGGPQASATATATLQAFPEVDVILRGEAESGWSAFVEQAKRQDWHFSRIPGAVFREASAIREAEPAPVLQDLDQAPFPLFQIVRELPSHCTGRVEVGRGCPYRCTYCSTSVFFSRKYRMKSPDRIIAEMDRVHSLHGIDQFDFVHDMFTANRELLRSICLKLKHRPYRWGCWSRADVLSDDLLQELRDAGCIGFFIGLESGSARLQKVIRKNLDLAQSIRNLRHAKTLGFSITTSIMLGYPGETVADLKDSLLLVAELMSGLSDQVNILPFVPLAGTEAAKKIHSYGFDGRVSNMMETERGLAAAEIDLIRRHFDLFSAFYYPEENEYPRSDYLALVVVLDHLKHYPAVRRFVLERDRAGFVRFLATGSFGVDVYRLSEEQIAISVLMCYALRSGSGWPVLHLLNYCKSAMKIAGGLPGLWASGVLPAEHVDLAFDPPRIPASLQPGTFIGYTLTRTRDGVQACLHAPQDPALPEFALKTRFT